MGEGLIERPLEPGDLTYLVMTPGLVRCVPL